MATIKALEGRTVHQIQSGQVIVDLCSVVKELVENSLDAGATSIDIRFKNNGLDSIEVQDNGSGIVSENYQTIALKHYTSKLSSYDDLSSLQTFGFRGEALSSLCALSKFHVTTARADEAPKGTRLDFEVSGQLKSTQVVASQKGTTVAVEDLFVSLPVRRRELEKNIKREYGKVLGILQACACISTQARISVSNVMAKGKRAVIFATKSNQTTRENIATVFGTKALPALVAMNLSFELQPTKTQEPASNSEPTFGEGRQAPDRQMFFVNSRPCGLPQVAKIFNEVYKAYNASQSPFIFANLSLDTNAYDVNVSPDKRTILLHDQTSLLESIRVSLTALFEKQDQTVPQSQKSGQTFKNLTGRRGTSSVDDTHTPGNHALHPPELQISDDSEYEVSSEKEEPAKDDGVPSLIESFAGRDSRERAIKATSAPGASNRTKMLSKDKQKLVKKLGREKEQSHEPADYDDARDLAKSDAMLNGLARPVEDFNRRIAEQQPDSIETPTPMGCLSREESQASSPTGSKSETEHSSGVVQNAFDRMRPRRNPPEVATITIGSKTTTSVLGPSSSSKRRKLDSTTATPIRPTGFADDPARKKFSSSMRAFAAPGSELIKSVGRPQSKSRVSRPYLGSASDNEDESRVTDLSPGALTTSEDDDESPAESPGGRANETLETPLAEAESDDDYLDDEGKKAREEATVADLIKQAEEKAAMPSEDNIRRVNQILRGRGQKDSTTQLMQMIDESVERIDQQLKTLETALQAPADYGFSPNPTAPTEDTSAEERLSLTVSKADFAHMHITGQFNLGFILAVRDPSPCSPNSDLFIIDQHASDEKYNFERLQAKTIVQNQRLVHPHKLDLTAIEEEIILDNNNTLLKNGFQVEIDISGDEEVGRRCKLMSLPMSREVTFDVTDLEELIALLADNPSSSSSESVPRPTKVRRMFAMRACRSSVMIGKTLTPKQMGALVRKMGEIDKPWNCPHGRPTMRHVYGLKEWEGWKEGGGLAGVEAGRKVEWGRWVKGVREQEEEMDREDDDGKEEQMEKGFDNNEAGDAENEEWS
ncbi:hypothetical protein HO133_003050 [Letharia lupina]|uniref:DNA mismatch repair protein PMS1 n=1 Tax=Letharia lupina TaxID=560253 RepID=A0A8H6CBZ0_9LECA|nr:uncharacterized protein HO133_003050 [Letharia lupina]KAF6220617.1 hypothetical protein HO133_003050 [Letharia lupina]